MKILLQRIGTKNYFRNGGHWTDNPEDAFDFMHTRRAIEFSHRYGLTDVQLAVKFIDKTFDSTFPIPPPGEPVPHA